MELLKEITKITQTLSDREAREKMVGVLNKAYLACLENAELMSNPSIIEAINVIESQESSDEEFELKVQAEEFNAFAQTVSEDFLRKWVSKYAKDA